MKNKIKIKKIIILELYKINCEKKMAKMNAVYDLLSIKRGSANQAANNVSANYDDGWAF